MTKTPLTIVTGALGSGKTTFVNRILTGDHGLKIGVIVNEFGDIGIDSALIVATEENMIELANGCICCMVREDLVTATKQLLEKGVNYLVVETSGLSEVIPVAMTFALTEELEPLTDLDSIICVIDAENYDENLKRDSISQEQLMSSDILLLNKMDVVDERERDRIESELKKFMPYAQIIRTIKCDAELRLLLGVGKFDPDRYEGKEEHKHTHTDFTAVSATTGPVNADKVQEFLEELPDNIFRAKAIICIKESQPCEGDEFRVIFHKVGKRTEMEFDRPWQEGEEKKTTVVFIGTDLCEEELQKKLEECK